jgi:hypothetical protein
MVAGQAWRRVSGQVVQIVWLHEFLLTAKQKTVFYVA